MSEFELNEDDDFGFSAVDELPRDDRVMDLYLLVVPLVENLLKDADKAYIHWPNRREKLEDLLEKMRELAQV